MNNLFDDDGFHWDYPLWIIRGIGVGLDGILATKVTGTDDFTTFVFTDEDLAQRYLDAAPPKTHRMESLTELAFFGLLVALELKGVKHVIFDAKPRSDEGKATSLPQVRAFVADQLWR